MGWPRLTKLRNLLSSFPRWALPVRSWEIERGSGELCHGRCLCPRVVDCPYDGTQPRCLDLL
eukprot:9840211-Lingulodinium_polyedra.AAC.1